MIRTETIIGVNNIGIRYYTICNCIDLYSDDFNTKKPKETGIKTHHNDGYNS